MKEAHIQIKHGMPYPFSEEDKEVFKSFHDNKIIKAKLYGTLKERSVLQNKWIHAIFRYTARDQSNPEWSTPERVKRKVKMAMKFFKDDVVVQDNKVFFELDSFAFDKMEQDRANKVYNDARDICAEFLGVDPETLQVYAEGE